MTDFAAAFKQGQVAAKQAVLAKEEIDGVLQSLSHDLLGATEGKLRIAIFEYNTVASGLITMAMAISSMPSDASKGIAKEKWICAVNGKAINDQETKIARWERPHEGYPCSITFEKREIRCHDREALELALAGLLQSAWVGEQLRELLERPVRGL